MSQRDTERLLVLGIGNLLMGDEGVGVHVVRELESRELPPGVVCVDGGTGSLTLLDELGQADEVVMIDATADGQPPGTITVLQPRFSSDYPPSLTAHDIGLKDLLDAFHLLGMPPSVTLVAVSIALPARLGLEMTPALRERVRAIADCVVEQVERIAGRAPA